MSFCHFMSFYVIMSLYHFNYSFSAEMVTMGMASAFVILCTLVLNVSSVLIKACTDPTVTQVSETQSHCLALSITCFFTFGK